MKDWNSEVHPHGDIVQIDARLHVVTGSLPKSPLPRTMTIWRMEEGGLVLHSAVALDEAHMAELETLGEPRVLIVPSTRHRSHAAAFKSRYPRMSVVCPAAARAKVAELVRVDASCEELLPSLGVTCHVPDGLILDELVHELPLDKGHALLFCDALFNLPHQPGFGGLILRLMRSTGAFRMTPVAKHLLLRDRAAFRAFLLRLGASAGLRVITLAHGTAITSDAPRQLCEAALRLG